MRFRLDICSKRWAVGGEAATVTLTGFSSFAASGEAQRRVFTVGAALKWVMFSVFRSFQIRG
jgi:hypothetical protein